MPKYFISCITPNEQLGAIQLECELDEVKTKSMEICPKRAEFRAYEVKEFDVKLPVGEFVAAHKLKALGY